VTKPLLIVVDDEQDMAEFISNVAKNLGFDVEIATSAREFQDLYRSTSPTAVVLDIVIPEMDGNEILEWMAPQDKFTPVILISGFDGKYIKAVKAVGRASGATIVGSLVKPIRADELETKLQQIIDAD